MPRGNEKTGQGGKVRNVEGHSGWRQLDQGENETPKATVMAAEIQVGLQGRGRFPGRCPVESVPSLEHQVSLSTSLDTHHTLPLLSPGARGSVGAHRCPLCARRPSLKEGHVGACWAVFKIQLNHPMRKLYLFIF